MQNRELAQKLFAMRRQLDQNLTTVLVAMAADNGAPFNEAVDELDGAVVAQAKLLGECRHGRACSFG